MISVIVLILAGFDILYWQLEPNIATYNNISLHTRAYLIIKSFSLVGIDLLLILLGWLFKQAKPKLKLLVELWFSTVILGVVVTTILALANNNVEISDFYNAVFPYIRNITYLNVGVTIGYLVIHFIKKASTNYITPFLLAILVIPSIINGNNFGFQNGDNPLFYALVFLLGRYTLNNDFLTHFFEKKTKIILGLTALSALLFIQQLIRPNFNLDDLLKYTNTSNILIVLIALLLAQWIVKYSDFKLSIKYLFNYLTLIQNTAIIVVATNLKTTGNSFETAVFAFTIIAISLVIAWIWGKCFTVQTTFNNRLPLKQQLKEFWPKTKPLLLMVAIAYVISFVLQAGLNSFDDYKNAITILATRQSMLWLSTLIVFLAIQFIYVLTKKYWLSISLVALFNLIFFFANKAKVEARQEPILPSDLSELTAINQLTHMVSPILLIGVVVAIVVMIALAVFLDHKKAINLHYSYRQMIIYLLLLPSLLGSSYFWNTNQAVNNLLHGLDDEPTFYSQLDGARKNGPIVQFLNNVHAQIMDEPNGYNKATIDNIVKQYKLSANNINQTRTNNIKDQTIIFNLSESFADPSRVPGVKLQQTPIPYINSLKKQTTSGLMISSGYGGGTANMEWMSLTGHNLGSLFPTLSIPYTQLVPRQQHVYSFVNSFNHAVGIHPFYGTFYSRIANYKKYGFNRFYYFDNPKYKIRHQKYIDHSQYLSDYTAYANVMDELNRYHKGQFINLMTMQNHQPYDQHSYHNLKQYSPSAVSNGTNVDSLNDYVTGLHYTDIAVKQFIKEINQINRPITVVFYGDHLPGGIYGNDMTVDNLPLHETDYFIYSNKYARQHGAKNINVNQKVVDPNDFMAMTLEQTNSKVNWYQALLTNMYHQLPAVAANPNITDEDAKSRNEFVGQDKQLVSYKSLSAKQKQLWHDYQLVQYDMLAGKGYAFKYLK